MKTIQTLIMCGIALSAVAQKESFDLVTCTSPKGWKKENMAGYSIIDNSRAQNPMANFPSEQLANQFLRYRG